MRIDKRLDFDTSCKLIDDLTKSDKKYLITRAGTAEMLVSVLTLVNQPVPQQGLNWFFVNAGFYGTMDFRRYATMYKSACDSCDLNAYWGFQGFIELEDFLIPENKTLIDPGALESFRSNNPWTKNLTGKKILIISPLKKSIDSQLENKNNIWENSDVLPDATYITYESVQSIGGKGPHKDWYVSFDTMCDDISKIDFDVALLGCGAYGLPLCDFIYHKLNKSSIYVGGGLQLYFGIKGKRWDTDSGVTKFYNENWIRPSKEEKPTNGDLVEGGCYW